MEERRRAERAVVRRVGRAVCDDGKVYSVIIWDLSETGALLICDGFQPPDDFTLFLGSERWAQRVRVARRQFKRVGITFSGEREQIDPTDQRLRKWLGS